MRGRLLGAIAVVTMVAGIAPAVASPPVVVVEQLITDSTGLAFALRPSYDAGGGAPLHLYFGYAEANTTEADADGQASWYNLSLVETAAFRPPEDCTPSKNLGATVGDADADGTPRNGTVQDARDWALGTLTATIGALQQGKQPPPPVVPGPRRGCIERLSGFAQSRAPAAGNITESATDNYLDSPTGAMACREQESSAQCAQYRANWPAVRRVVGTGGVVQDGAFEAVASAAPPADDSAALPDVVSSQRSDGIMFGVGDGVAVSIGSARTTSEAVTRRATPQRDGATGFVTEVTSTLRMTDVCLLSGCALRLDSLVQSATVVVMPGKPPVARTRTAAVVDGETLSPALLPGLDLFGGSLGLQWVADTGSCNPAQADPSIAVADTGGFVMYGKGSANTFTAPDGSQTTIPGGGGSIMIGGACARARIRTVTFVVPWFVPDGGDPGTDDRTIVLPGGPIVRRGPVGHPEPVYGPPRTVTREVVTFLTVGPLAWRMAPWWGTVLAVLALLAIGVARTPELPVVGPVARALDRFSRQFVRG